MNTWETDLATEWMKGGGREVLRILTRPWSEDSSTPIRKSEKNRQRGTTEQPTKAGNNKKRPTAQQPTKQTKQQEGEEGGQVLKNLTRLWPGSSSTQSTKQKGTNPNNQDKKIKEQ